MRLSTYLTGALLGAGYFASKISGAPTKALANRDTRVGNTELPTLDRGLMYVNGKEVEVRPEIAKYAGELAKELPDLRADLQRRDLERWKRDSIGSKSATCNNADTPYPIIRSGQPDVCVRIDSAEAFPDLATCQEWQGADRGYFRTLTGSFRVILSNGFTECTYNDIWGACDDAGYRNLVDHSVDYACAFTAGGPSNSNRNQLWAYPPNNRATTAAVITTDQANRLCASIKTLCDNYAASAACPDVNHYIISRSTDQRVAADECVPLTGYSGCSIDNHELQTFNPVTKTFGCEPAPCTATEDVAFQTPMVSPPVEGQGYLQCKTNGTSFVFTTTPTAGATTHYARVRTANDVTLFNDLCESTYNHCFNTNGNQVTTANGIVNIQCGASHGDMIYHTPIRGDFLSSFDACYQGGGSGTLSAYFSTPQGVEISYAKGGVGIECPTKSSPPCPTSPPPTTVTTATSATTATMVLTTTSTAATQAPISTDPPYTDTDGTIYYTASSELPKLNTTYQTPEIVGQPTAPKEGGLDPTTIGGAIFGAFAGAGALLATGAGVAIAVKRKALLNKKSEVSPVAYNNAVAQVRVIE